MATSLLGAGVYDAREVSRLLAVPVSSIIRWGSSASGSTPAIVRPSLGRMFDFQDLVSMAVVAELRGRSVPEEEVRSGIAYLRSHTGHERPLARREVVDALATSGQAWLIDHGDDGWYDIGKGGQGTFEAIVRIYLRQRAYDGLGVARLWRPANGVVLDPRVQAGAPCVEGTRIPTETIAAMAEIDGVDEVADDLELTLVQVTAAMDFEAGLAAGRSIAA